MADILPIDREVLADNKEEAEAKELKENKTINKEEVVELEEKEEEARSEAPKKEVFEKPKEEPPVEISKKTGKPKRKLTETQLANLKKAREKSQARRKELKEAKDIVKEQKKMERELKQEAKLKKREEQEEIIRLKAKMKSEAERHATWDEERLTGLMEKTIENFIKKKKAMKPEPKTFIPNNNLPYTNLPPHAQTPVYYTQPPPQQYYHQNGQPAPVNMSRRKPQNKNNNPLNSLFGFDPDQQ